MTKQVWREQVNCIHQCTVAKRIPIYSTKPELVVILPFLEVMVLVNQTATKWGTHNKENNSVADIEGCIMH